MKEKLITIKPFLNTKLSPNGAMLGQKLYPLYYQITYNRNNTQIKSAFEIYLNTIASASSSEKNLMQTEIKNLEKIVQMNSKAKTISLAGIKTKHAFYLKPIDEIVQEVMIQKIQRAVSQSNSEFQNCIKFEGVGINILLLYKATKLLIENINKFLPEDFKAYLDTYKAFSKSHFSSARVINWIDDTFKNELKREFLSYFEGNQKDAEKSFIIIDTIVAERIKFL